MKKNEKKKNEKKAGDIYDGFHTLSLNNNTNVGNSAMRTLCDCLLELAPNTTTSNTTPRSHKFRPLHASHNSGFPL